MKEQLRFAFSPLFFQVNLKEQGQLIRQDEFTVFFRKKKCVRRVFLFEDLILFSKTKKTDVGNDVYVYKQSFKVSVRRRPPWSLRCGDVIVISDI